MLFDNFAKLKRSSRNALSAALLIIAAIAVYNWMVAPHATYLFAAQQYESAIEGIAKKNNILSNTVEVKEKKLEELRKQFAQLQRTLFTPDEAQELLGDLRVICEEAGCTVNSLNFVTSKPGFQHGQAAAGQAHPTYGGQVEGASGVVANNAVLSVRGVYGNVIELLERIQKRTQGVWIDSIKMTALDEDSAKLNCDIAITIYTIRDKDTTANE